MKKILLTMVMALAFAGAFAGKGTDEGIVLKGEAGGGVILRSLFQPMEAFKTDDAVRVDFLATAVLTIEVKNEAGTLVYNQTVNAVTDSSLYIDTTAFPDGNYTITFTNVNGYRWKGDFTITN